MKANPCTLPNQALQPTPAARLNLVRRRHHSQPPLLENEHKCMKAPATAAQFD
jgi:hypothetical protein